MGLQKSDDWIDQVSEKNSERENDEHRSRDIYDGQPQAKQKRGEKDIQRPAIRECARIRSHQCGPVCDSSFCLIESRAFSREDRVLSTATFRTMLPLNPVRPACCEPFKVIR